MQKILLDYSYLKSLIFKDHQKHELAQKMAENIKNTHHLYLPTYTLNHIFDDINNIRDEKTKKLFENICSTTRNITPISRKTQKSAYELYETTNILTYEECITVTLMHLYEIKYIISFNEKYDNIKNIIRLFEIDKYNEKQLNFYRYA